MAQSRLMGASFKGDEPGPGQYSLCIGILSLSAVPDDPRVRRQGDLFTSQGWRVRAFGLGGASSAAPEWPYFALPDIETDDRSEEALARWRRSRTARRFSKLLHASRTAIDPRYAEAAYWALDRRFAALRDLAGQHRVDVWLANDWQMLPIVCQLAKQQRVPYVYDTHELAVHEYAHRRIWSLFQRPLIAAVERAGFARAALTSCVSPGIADFLHSYYGLSQRPMVVRNLPYYEAHPLRPCGETIEVLYHGVVSPGRGLEACVESVASWKPEFRLTIRGPASDSYRAELLGRAKAAGVDGRIVFAPPVPMVALVSEAARFDIGLFALPDHSKQNVLALPNKFFEYMMAGLALCVSDLPEMSALLRQHDLGRLIPTVAPAAIATAINGFDRAAIEHHKARALEAARILNWEIEGERFFAAVAEASSRSRALLAAQRASSVQQLIG